MRTTDVDDVGQKAMVAQSTLGPNMGGVAQGAQAADFPMPGRFVAKPLTDLPLHTALNTNRCH